MKSLLRRQLLALMLGVTSLAIVTHASFPAFASEGHSGDDSSSSASSSSGSDDGPGHDANDDSGSGNDDGPNHDANDDHGGCRNDPVTCAINKMLK